MLGNGQFIATCPTGVAGTCTTTCGGGGKSAALSSLQNRRSEYLPVASDTQECNLVCPIDHCGLVRRWGACTQSCGGGRQTRSADQAAQHGGAGCPALRISLLQRTSAARSIVLCQRRLGCLRQDLRRCKAHAHYTWPRSTVVRAAHCWKNLRCAMRGTVLSLLCLPMGLGHSVRTCGGGGKTRSRSVVFTLWWTSAESRRCDNVTLHMSCRLPSLDVAPQAVPQTWRWNTSPNVPWN